MQPLEIFVICYSAVACCCSLAVIVTIMFFRRMQIGKFMPIILYISVCDLGQNIASSFGFPDDQTDLCWAQGILAAFFTISGWFWTTLLLFRIYSLVRYSKCHLSTRHMHMIAWGMGTFLTLIPLTSVDYGAGPTQSQWCLLVPRAGYPRWWATFWAFCSFFAWLFILSGLMFAWHIIIRIKFRNSPMIDVIKRTYDKVYLYPVVMVLCWSLNFVCDMIDFRENDSTFTAISMLCGVSNGILSAMIFLWKSEEARARWSNYFRPVRNESDFDSNVEPKVQADFEMDDRDDLTDYCSSHGMNLSICNFNDSMISMSDLTTSTNPMRSVGGDAEPEPATEPV